MSYSSSPTPPSRSPQRSSGAVFGALAVLVALNVVVFLIELASAPFSDMMQGSLVEHGGLSGWQVDHGDWWRIVTSGFLHANGAHLFGNLVALLILGGVLSLSVGPLRMVLVYAAGLLGSSFSVLVFDPHSLTVGASGAIFGLAGGALLIGWRQRRIWLLLFAAAWIVYSLSSTLFVPGISQAGHLGGLVAGALAGALLVDDGARLRSEGAAAGLVAALLVILFAGALLV
ncbi:rhomboid family intramembrane serine protease [Conexibacter stalactiti]|uniref:Rhomboid family intramembrane serine protease n=1 Tax=Conexibacter stalactiti TaxID=1940611 RepID=A0ABU4HP33_9ACTN|nr:rhomboid family intramembrane serine protease [Conexibacter stalactiti]MDW5593809.1 rhomboid family intramembrane serine protease [Conexibacter stalactiti]MEC5034451.1 rhomboid family intramembrane serine protease [Conexibacter stalactiti]